MLEDVTGLGGMAAVLGPAVVGAWLVWRWVRRMIRLALVVVIGSGAAWLGLDPLGTEAPPAERTVTTD